MTEGIVGQFLRILKTVEKKAWRTPKNVTNEEVSQLRKVWPTAGYIVHFLNPLPNDKDDLLPNYGRKKYKPDYKKRSKRKATKMPHDPLTAQGLNRLYKDAFKARRVKNPWLDQYVQWFAEVPLIENPKLDVAVVRFSHRGALDKEPSNRACS